MSHMVIIIQSGKCPKCECTDIRNRVWFLECYKCGYKHMVSADVKRGAK